jgi:16S rRNA (guanine966-N2)-methyltransferase
LGPRKRHDAESHRAPAKRLDIMRIISGRAKGKRLNSPKDQSIRPTADRVKESVFNMLTQPWEDKRVLDLFSGTGSLGLEAASRGAREIVFVENARSALNILRKNISLCGLGASARVLAMPVPRGLTHLEQQGESFHTIFADPPYGKGWVERIIRAILAYRLLAVDGVLVLEHASYEPAPEAIGDFFRFNQRTYGDTVISFFGFEGLEHGRENSQMDPSSSSFNGMVLSR